MHDMYLKSNFSVNPLIFWHKFHNVMLEPNAKLILKNKFLLIYLM